MVLCSIPTRSHCLYSTDALLSSIYLLWILCLAVAQLFPQITLPPHTHTLILAHWFWSLFFATMLWPACDIFAQLLFNARYTIVFVDLLSMYLSPNASPHRLQKYTTIFWPFRRTDGGFDPSQQPKIGGKARWDPADPLQKYSGMQPPPPLTFLYWNCVDSVWKFWHGFKVEIETWIQRETLHMVSTWKPSRDDDDDD